jgi:hypothetical protein
VESTSILHDQIGNTCFGEPKDVLDNATAFHAGDGVFDLDAHTGNNAIKHLIRRTQRLAF